MNVTRAQLATKRRARPTPRRERDVQAAILALLRTLPNVTAWRANVGAVKTGDRFVRFGVKGLPDIQGWRVVYVRPGVPIAQSLMIEVKRPGAKLSPAQEMFQAQAIASNVCYIEARSVDDVARVLTRAPGRDGGGA